MMKTSVRIAGAFVVALVVALGHAAHADKTYPPLSAHLMAQDQEIALARTAAPANVSGPATVKVLTPQGYKVVATGSNGFVCLVMRSFSAPTYTPKMFVDLVYDASVRAPICFNAQATVEVLPYYELRTELGMKGQSPDQIRAGVEAAYKTGRLPRRTGVSFAYMWSAEQNLGPMVHHWHPHVMIFAPNLDNAMLGNNDFGAPLPQLTDDAGTPFSVAVVPVDDRLFVGHAPAAADHAAPGH
jgi:hypothetical protein